ncbi:MAG TPA: fumarylacetoacetate hydrolase family protein [Nitriliruptorales bacterium]
MPLVVRFVDQDRPTFGIVVDDHVEEIAPHPFTTYERTGHQVPLEGLKLLAPIIPSKVVCVGRNYADHASELDNEVPEKPLLFLKPATGVVGPGHPIRIPIALTNDVHHEAELAVVIGGLLSRVSPDEARKGIFGYTAANDVTARDLQQTDVQWTRSKGFDTFCPLGPAISTDLDPDNANIRCLVDGEVRQEANTSQMIHKVHDLVSYISHSMTLLPGDVVLTGTPAGVGRIEPGQCVRVELDGVGVLENLVVERGDLRYVPGRKQ